MESRVRIPATVPHRDGLSIRRLVVLIAIIAGIGIAYLKALPDHWLAHDEHAWVRRGIILTDYAARLDFTPDVWDRFISFDQPILAELLFGAAVKAGHPLPWKTLFASVGFDPVTHTPAAFDGDIYVPGVWWVDYVYKKSPGQSLPESARKGFALIVEARYVAVSFAIGALITIFVLGYLLGGYLCGVFSVLLLATSGAFYDHALHALSDPVYLCLEIIVVALLIRLSDGPMAFDRLIQFTVLTGVAIGLLSSTKLTGLMFLGAYFLVATAASTFPARGAAAAAPLWKRLLFFAIGAAIAIETFMLLNPYIWHSPVWHTITMLMHRNAITRSHALLFPQDTHATFFGHLAVLLKRTVWPDFPGIYGHRVFGNTMPLKLAEFLLLLTGLAAMVRRLPVSRRTFTFLMLWAFVVLMTAYTVPISFDRYYMPILPFPTVLVAMGAAALMRKLASWRVSRIRPVTAAVTRTEATATRRGHRVLPKVARTSPHRHAR